MPTNQNPNLAGGSPRKKGFRGSEFLGIFDLDFGPFKTKLSKRLPAGYTVPSP